jgi:uncharacterized SAM-binding protein YcdF (DUF218 family)
MAKTSGRRRIVFLLALPLVAFALIAFHRQILTAAGEWLLAEDKLVKSDAAVVISGEDGDGMRTRAAVKLYKQHWVERVVLSGARGSFGHYETDFMGPLALSLGVPQKDLLIIAHRGRSTFEEANAVLPDLQRAGIHSIILVTSNYHTRRARRYFRRVFQDRISVVVHGADAAWFQPDSWWQSREGLKFFFFEFTKSWTSYLE